MSVDWQASSEAYRLDAERLRAALKQIIARQDELAARIDRNSFESGYRQGTDQCAFIAEEALAST